MRLILIVDNNESMIVIQGVFLEYARISIVFGLLGQYCISQMEYITHLISKLIMYISGAIKYINFLGIHLLVSDKWCNVHLRSQIPDYVRVQMFSIIRTSDCFVAITESI